MSAGEDGRCECSDHDDRYTGGVDDLADVLDDFVERHLLSPDMSLSRALGLLPDSWDANPVHGSAEYFRFLGRELSVGDDALIAQGG